MNKNLIKSVVILLTGLLLIIACKKKVKIERVEVPTTPGVPTVVSLVVDSLSSSSVVLSGQITREGNGEIAVVGFCWSDETMPVVDQTPTNHQLPDNKFRYRVTGLKAGTIYNFRAYATNEKGVGYGEVISFQTRQGWKKVEQPANTMNRQFNKIISTGTKLVGISNNAIYTSADNGLTWSTSSTGLMGSIGDITNKGEVLFASTSNGVYVSNNGGGIWLAANAGLESAGTVSHLHVSGNLVFAASYASVYRSNNNGISWTLTNPLTSFNSIMGLTSQGNSLLALSSYQTYQSDDEGMTWTTFTNNQGSYVNRVKATADALVGMRSQQIVRSTDKAQNWTAVMPQINFSDVIASGNNVLAYGYSSEYIYLSADGGKTWLQNDGGMSGIYAYTFVFHKDYVLANTSGGFYKLMLN